MICSHQASRILSRLNRRQFRQNCNSKFCDQAQNHPEILRLIEEIQRKDIEQDQQLLLIFEYLKQLEQSKKQEIEFQERRKIGFNLPGG